MNSRPNLRVRISADLADIKQGLGLLRGELARVKKDVAQTVQGMQADFTGGIKRIKGLIGGLFAGVSAGALVKGIVGETGQAQSELAQLRATLKSTREAAGLTEQDLVGMAERFALATTHSTGQIIDAETRLLSYSGIAKNEFGRALQLAIDQSVRLGQDLTESAEAVGKALEYPAQGVASLTKQGFRFTEEQKKMLKELERTGRLAEAQAIVMGVMEESYAGAAEAARNTLPGALKALGNAIQELLDGNGGRGATQLTKAINDLVNVLRSPQTKAAFGDLANDVLETVAAFAAWMAQDGIRYIQQLAAAVAFLVRNLDVLIVFLGARLLAAGLASLPVLYARVVALRAQLVAAAGAATTLRGALALLGGPVGIAIAALATAIYVLYQRTTQAKRAAEEHTKALDDNRRLSRDSAQAALEDAKAKRQQAFETLKAAQAALAEKQIRLDAAREDQGRRSGRSAYLQGGVVAAEGTAVLDAQNQVNQLRQQYEDWGKRLVELSLEINDQVEGVTTETADIIVDTSKKVAGSNALLRDSIARSLAELDRLYADHDIGISEYFRRRRDLQQQAIDAEIEQARMQLAVAKEGDARRRIEEDIIKLQRDRAEIAAATARGEKKALDELDKAVGDVYIKRLEAEGKLAQAVRARLEEEFRERIVQLQNEGREGDVRRIRLYIDSEVARGQLSEFENEMTRTLARLQGTEQTLSAQQHAGLLGIVESEQRIREERTTALQQLQDLRQRAIDFLATMSVDSPEAQQVLEFLQRLDGDIASVASSMQRFRQQVADAAIDSMTNFFMDLVEGSKSASEALRDFVRGFVLAMAQIAARALATFLVLRMLDAIYPGLGQATAAMMSVGTRHSGGLAGAPGGVSRRVSPAIFSGAPEYHSGGIAGLEPNEVPAILERGEEVLTRDDPRHRDNMQDGGGGRDRVTTPVVVFGDQELANALAGHAGEQMVITHVRNNRRLIDE